MVLLQPLAQLSFVLRIQGAIDNTPEDKSDSRLEGPLYRIIKTNSPNIKL